MDIWLIFAYISEGMVKNIATYLYTGYTEATDHAKAFCADANAIAVDVTHIPVQIGDTYSNGNFYRGSEMINPIPTVEEELNTTKAELASAQNDIADLAEAILEIG